MPCFPVADGVVHWTTNVERYKSVMRRLLKLRKDAEATGGELDEETDDELTEILEDLWWQLSDEEHQEMERLFGKSPE